MSGRPLEATRAHLFFAELQASVKKTVADKLAPAVQFHSEPSKHFFLYRPGRPSLRLDVELADDSQSIRFATNQTTKGRFNLSLLAGGKVGMFNGPHPITIPEATNLLVQPFLP